MPGAIYRMSLGGARMIPIFIYSPLGGLLIYSRKYDFLLTWLEATINANIINILGSISGRN